MHPTAARLLVATEHLLVEKGELQISLRDITERAGTNVAAVSYHFRSKDALIALAFGSALHEVTEARRHHLRTLPPDAALIDVVRAWLAPALTPDDQPPREAQLWRLIARGAREQAPGLIEHAGRQQQYTDDELTAHLRRHLTHLSPDELAFRQAATLAVLPMVAPASPGGGESRSAGLPAVSTDVVLDWIVAGLSGPGRHP